MLLRTSPTATQKLAVAQATASRSEVPTIAWGDPAMPLTMGTTMALPLSAELVVVSWPTATQVVALEQATACKIGSTTWPTDAVVAGRGAAPAADAVSPTVTIIRARPMPRRWSGAPGDRRREPAPHMPALSTGAARN